MSARQFTSRELNQRYKAALARERSAWEFLQHMREAGTAAQRSSYLQDWTEAIRALREAEQALRQCLAREAMTSLRSWLGQAGLPPQPASPDASVPATPLPLPQPGQKLRARDGATWCIESAAQDPFEPGQFLAHIRRGPTGASPADEMEVYGDDWPLVCRVYGLRPLEGQEPARKSDPSAAQTP